MKTLKLDITNIDDIKMIVDSFYEKVKRDEMLCIIFSHVNWEEHLPTMYKFWDNVLFHTGGYSGNPMAKHQAVHQRFPLNHDHFQQWLHLFKKAVKELYAGDNADSLIQRAKNIATVMELNII